MMVDRRWPTCISFAMLGDEKSTTTLDTVPKEKINKRQQSLPHPMCLIWVLLGGGEGRLASADPHTLFAANSAHSNREGPVGTPEQASSLGLCYICPAEGQGSLPDQPWHDTLSPGSPVPHPPETTPGTCSLRHGPQSLSHIPFTPL